jgi:phosphatidylinositol alpha-mannosyltransferase
VEKQPGVSFVGRTVPVPANGSVAPLAFGPGAAVTIKKVLAGFSPDVVHLHEPLIPSLSLLALMRATAPCLGTFHAAAEGSMGYRIGAPVLKLAARQLAVRTAVSDAARELVQRYLPSDYHLTPNGVDVARFADAEPADVGPGQKVLFLGRLERRKGLEVLLQAMTRLRDTGIELLVAGSGPQEKDLRALAERLLVDARFLGKVDEQTKASLFKRADVYCAPGTGGESFGIVLIEAMAAGTPVVCSDLPGFRAVASGSAVLVTPGDAGLLADAIKKVLADGSLAAKMGKAGTRTASGFDWTRLVGNVENLYERAIKEPAHV